MKKFLCIVMSFLLCISMCATAEENTNEEVVSNIVTYGPVSFDTFGKWEKMGPGSSEAYAFAEAINHTEAQTEVFVLLVQDIWNGLLSEEQRAEYSMQIGGQEGFDSIYSATQNMEEYVKEWNGDISQIETVKLGEYNFCRMLEPLKEIGDIQLLSYTYFGVINGYLIKIFTAFPRRIHPRCIPCH